MKVKMTVFGIKATNQPDMWKQCFREQISFGSAEPKDSLEASLLACSFIAKDTRFYDASAFDEKDAGADYWQLQPVVESDVEGAEGQEQDADLNKVGDWKPLQGVLADCLLARSAEVRLSRVQLERVQVSGCMCVARAGLAHRASGASRLARCRQTPQPPSALCRLFSKTLSSPGRTRRPGAKFPSWSRSPTAP